MESWSGPSADSQPSASRKVLRFSAIGSLQTAHTLSYELKEDRGMWILSVCLCGSDKIARAESLRIAVDRALAFQLRDYLYENAVPIENWQDVLAELLPAGTQALI